MTQGEKLAARALERRIATLERQIVGKQTQIAELKHVLAGVRGMLTQALVRGESEK